MDMPEGFVLAAIARARGSARRVRFQPLSRSREPAGRRASSARRACAARRSCASAIRCSQVAAAARQRQHAPAQARRGQLRRDHPRRRGTEAARLRASASPRCSIPRKACRRAGQGALAIECRADRADVIAALAPLADRRDDARDHRAERASRARCRGSCHTPLAAYALPRHGELWLRGLLASRDGREVMRGERRARAPTPRGRARRSGARSPPNSSRAAPRASRRHDAPARRAEQRAVRSDGIGILVTRPARQAARSRRRSPRSARCR